MSWRGSKWPEDGYEDCTQDKDKKIERHAKFEVVCKTVTTRAIYHEVGLIADGRGKTGAGPNSARAHALLANALLLGGQWAHLALTSSFSLSGREEEARTEAEEVLRINPKFSRAHFAKIVLYKNQADKERLVDALRKAGLK